MWGILLCLGARPAAAEVELAFVGDVIFGDYRARGYSRHGPDDHDPFAKVAQLLRADLVVANLETPLQEPLPRVSPVSTRHRFGASLAQAGKLVRGGVHAVSLANNHAYDLRGDGARQTPALLGRLGVAALGEAGAGLRVQSIERGGLRLGFVAVTTIRNVSPRRGEPVQPRVAVRELAARIGPLLREARRDHDLLAVLVHWGREYVDEPGRTQRRAAHDLIDAGADLVIGHHPHVLQGLEQHHGGLIAYSLGNFVFPGANALARLTGVLRVRLPSREVIFHPAHVAGRPRCPRPASGSAGRRVRERVRLLSERLGAVVTEQDGDLRLRLGPRARLARAGAGPKISP